MPALPAAVTTYLTTVKDSLKDHASDDATVDVQPYQYIRAMHLSAALDLLQNACDQTASLTATGGTTRTVVDGGGTFVAGSMIGYYVTFAGNVTAALAGLTYRVHSNTTTTLTMTETMAGAPQAGDTYTLRAGFLDECISDLREAKNLSDSPAGDLWGDQRVVVDGMARAVRQLGATITERTLFSGVTTTGSTTTAIALNLRGGTVRIDEFVGLKLNLTGSNPVRVISNTEAGVCTVNMAVSGGAPGAAVAVTLTVPNDSADFRLGRDVHPGAHQSNYVLADMIEQLQTAVTNFVLPV